MEQAPRKLYHPYVMAMLVNIVLLIAAFVFDSPATIARGFWKIVTCRGVLITDYMAVGGIGATLLNAALVSTLGVGMLFVTRAKPNGSTIMALWLSTSFALFGKNIFNMFPLIFGVWLYSKFRKEPFINFTLVALLSATLSPVVSGISFHSAFSPVFGIPLGICIGIFTGFIFPPVSSFTMRVHGGYNLYNMGFAGGLISTFIISAFESVGVVLPRELEWSSGNNLQLAILLYIIAAGLMLRGLFPAGHFSPPPYRRLIRHSGRVFSDYYVLFGNSIYFNMGLLCAIATTLVLVLGADLNGATMCGIFTIVGFAAFGKHLGNILPILIGAIICTNVNLQSPTDPSNILAILFSTGLAPIAGQFGWVWGIITGYLHVNTIMHIGFLNSGLNLYNNGYAAGLVALLMLPLITAFQKGVSSRYERSS